MVESSTWERRTCMNESRIEIQPKPLTAKNVAMIIFGSILYAGAVNIFLQPLQLYAGGIPGLSQMIRTLCLPHTGRIDAAGIINFCFNIPLFILAYRSMNKKLLIGTLISVVMQTIIFTLVKIPTVPVIDDKLAAIMIAGLVGGFGCGVILSNSGTGGGLDILGVFLTKTFSWFTVGRLSILFNAVLYMLCAVFFDLSTALYSILFIAFFSFTIDRFHYQNIEMELMIFTHHPEVAQVILKKYVRGVTEWEGKGSYTNQETHVLVTVVAKSEVEQVKKDILAGDPKAFIIVHDHTEVTGGYQKRLDI